MSRIKNFQKKMVELSADAALISSELNIRYLSKFNFTDGYILVTRDNAYLFTDFRYIEAAKAQVDANDFTIVMPETTMGVALAQTLDNVGAKVVLMHERSVLGGNASSEIRMWICGAVGETNRESIPTRTGYPLKRAKTV